MEKDAKIYVSGHRGLVGSAIVRKLKEKGVAVYFEKKDFYTVKMPINAVNTALSKGSWCLVGV